MAKAMDHPFPQRLYHWINLICMFLLILTGFYIHRPFAEGYMALARSVHSIAMYSIFINLTARVYYAFFGKHRDASQFSLSGRDITVLLKTIKAYLYVGHPTHNNKYNPLQKLTYIAYIPLVLFQFFTGFLIYRPAAFQGAVDAMGGVAQLKAVHFLFMWFFIAFIIVHLYMTLTETIDEVKLMLFGVADKTEKA
jgi:Ni/Fe-hydrogenase 1 B-type cytochrome subunit